MTNLDDRRTRVAIGVGARPIAGESDCGDACEAIPWSHGVVAAIVDGLGHGGHAALAARAFVSCVRECVELPLHETFARAHRSMLKTRGAVAAVARFDEALASVEVAVLGNIAVSMVRGAEHRSEHPIAVAGVLGSSYRPVRPHVLAFGPGDVLVMHTDGVRSHFDLDTLRGLPVQVAVEMLLRTQAKSTDDAGCVVARRVLDAAWPRSSLASGAVNGERCLPVRTRSDAECVALEALTFASASGLSPRAQWEVSIAASELATNIAKFAGDGEIRLRCEQVPQRAVVIEAIDRGGGIADLDLAITDGFSEGAPLTPERARRTGQGLGAGLGSVHRMMDRVDIESDPARGTRIVARKFRAPA